MERGYLDFTKRSSLNRERNNREKPSQTQIKLEPIFEDQQDFEQVSVRPRGTIEIIDSEEFIHSGGTKSKLSRQVKSQLLFPTAFLFYCIHFKVYHVYIKIQRPFCLLT